MPGKSYHRRLRSLLLRLCDVFQALINSFVCWFCRGALGLILFQIMIIMMNYLLHVVCVWQTWNGQHHHPVERAAHHQHSDHGAPAQDHSTLQGEAACLWLKCVASTSRFWHCRSALSLAFWLLWSDYCHPCLTLFKSIFCYYSGTSRIRLHFSALSLVFWLLWSDYGLHLWALIYIYFLITVEPAISGTHAWDWHKIMVKEKGSMMDASVKYLIKSVQLVLFLNVICVWPEENDFVVFDQKRMIFALFDQKRTILLCLTRREWFCLLHLTRREQFCFDSQCE